MKTEIYHNATFTFVLTQQGAKDTDGWEHDAWLVTITSQNRTMATPFKMGIGHRIEKRGQIIPKPPTAKDVMYSLLSDMRLGEDTFEDFCSNLGYDTDSRKALAGYLECQDIGARLRQTFGLKALAEISEELEDY